MAAWWKLLQIVCVFYLALTLLEEVEAEPRGGRFGGRYGGRYGTRARYGNRYSSTRTRVRYGGSSTRVRVRVRNGYGYGTSSWRWHGAAAAGAIYGYHSYSLRHSYHRYPDRQPRICINEYDYAMDNGTHYSLFICPMLGQSDAYTYCCGSEDRQHCCSFWGSGGRVFGVVVAILFFLGIGALIVWCVCCKSKNGQPSRWSSRRTRHPQKAHTNVTYSGVSAHPPAPSEPVPPPPGPNPAYPQGDQYPLKPLGDPTYPPTQAPYPDPNQAGYPNAPAPPYGASQADGAPYPPAGGPAPYPPGPAAPYPPADGGYPPNAPPAAPYPMGGPPGSYAGSPPPPYPQ